MSLLLLYSVLAVADDSPSGQVPTQLPSWLTDASEVDRRAHETVKKYEDVDDIDEASSYIKQQEAELRRLETYADVAAGLEEKSKAADQKLREIETGLKAVPQDVNSFCADKTPDESIRRALQVTNEQTSEFTKTFGRVSALRDQGYLDAAVSNKVPEGKEVRCVFVKRWVTGDGSFLQLLRETIAARKAEQAQTNATQATARANIHRLLDAYSKRIVEAQGLREKLQKRRREQSGAFGLLPWIVVEFFGFSVLVMLTVGIFPERVQREWLGSGQAIQLMTVSIMLISVLGLGLAGILHDNTLSALLGSVGGYVLSQGVGVAAEARRRQQAAAPEGAEAKAPKSGSGEEAKSTTATSAATVAETALVPKTDDTSAAGSQAPAFPPSERILSFTQVLGVAGLGFAAYRLRGEENGYAAWGLGGLALLLLIHVCVRVGVVVGKMLGSGIGAGGVLPKPVEVTDGAPVPAKRVEEIQGKMAAEGESRNVKPGEGKKIAQAEQKKPGDDESNKGQGAEKKPGDDESNKGQEAEKKPGDDESNKGQEAEKKEA